MIATNVCMKAPINSKPQRSDARLSIASTGKRKTANPPAVIATARSLPFSHKRWFVANPNVPDSALND